MRSLLLGGLCFALAFGQESVIQTTTRLVQVSVVARSHDQSAAGLTVDDFKVFVDGHQQKISFFSAVAASLHPTPTLPIAPHTYTNVMASKGQSMNGVTVVLLDLVNTKLRDRIYARQQLIKYLQSIPSTDRVAVYTFNGRLRVLHDYTASMEQFQARLAESKGQLVNVSKTEEGGAIEASEEEAFSDLMGGGASNDAEQSFYLRNRVVGTLNVLKFIAAHLADVPGRKNLVWMSGGFPLNFGLETMSNFSEDFSNEMDAAVRALSDASVAVYPVDARGLTPPSGFDASQRTIPDPMAAARSGTAQKRTPDQYMVDVHLGMEELAHRTGGHAFYNTNDLAKAIHEAVDDSALTYTLGFYPSDEKHNREFHKLKVEVDKPHINLTYRTGYLDLAEIPKDDKTRSIQVHDALWSPLDATQLQMSVRLSQALSSAAVLLGQAAPAPSNALVVAVALDSKGIQLEPKADRYSGRIDVLMVQFDKSGKPIDSPMETVQLNMLEPTYRKFLVEGLNVKETLTISPRALTLRVVVRDYGSGMIGSVTVPLKDAA